MAAAKPKPRSTTKRTSSTKPKAVGPGKRTTKVTTSKSPAKNAQASMEAKFRQRGFSEKQAKAFAKNAAKRSAAARKGK